MQKIIREFITIRNEREIIYPFTTFSVIFEPRKLDSNVGKLKAYLQSVFLQGISDGERKSVSEMPDLITQHVKFEHEIIKLMEDCQYRGTGFEQHARVQNHLLKNDPCCIATEIPVWDSEILGHIDIIRIVGETIEILDFKPDAHAEGAKAFSQIARYRRLLAQNTGIDPKFILAGIFDDKTFYLLQTQNGN